VPRGRARTCRSEYTAARTSRRASTRGRYQGTINHHPATPSTAALARAVYSSAWGRFFIGGGSPELLGAPLLGIPSPLVFAPIVVPVLSAYLVDSWPVLAASVCFGALHVWASSVRS
jgi:hypothetical protein